LAKNVIGATARSKAASRAMSAMMMGKATSAIFARTDVHVVFSETASLKKAFVASKQKYSYLLFFDSADLV
jgi:hypothetical protein